MKLYEGPGQELMLALSNLVGAWSARLEVYGVPRQQHTAQGRLEIALMELGLVKSATDRVVSTLAWLRKHREKMEDDILLLRSELRELQGAGLKERGTKPPEDG